MRNIRPVQWGQEQYINLKGVFEPINNIKNVGMFSPTIWYDGISFLASDARQPFKFIHDMVKHGVKGDYDNRNR